MDWKHALRIDSYHPGIRARDLLFVQARIVQHDADQALFRKTVRKAVDKGHFPERSWR